jgi:hypothetical protein
MSQGPIQRVGNREYTQIEGKQWTRSVDTTQWVRVPTPPPAQPPALQLMLVREHQAPGEPHHWSLCLAYEGQAGMVYQVKGDALAMSYDHASNVNPLESVSFKDSYIIARPTAEQAARVGYWVNQEVPPRAPNQAAVQENCQGWTIRVMRRLVQEGVVAQSWLNSAENLKEPLR